ncbi:hypothetical protein PR202_ga25520 [Eleusine coracana subsp. coracana]|uniref:Uncharacterized protein n=1 Tax=Eleusine coracana subsp. coracana TaxID=191504 RepID=A0AAV5DBJ1_ELECO|nr:hypothetical protein PR202_ga25520 [Eleusine coracana subsp. coracana]
MALQIFILVFTNVLVRILCTCTFDCLQTDMEEAKTQENKKLKQQLQELQLQSKETKDLLKKEREITKEALEKAALVPEVHVDVTRVDELTAENEKLKTLVDSLETKVQKTEQKFEEMKEARDEWLKKATDAESKINELTNTMLRFVYVVA